MYVGRGQRGRFGRVARADYFSGFRGLRGLGQDDGFDWSSFADTLVTTAGKVAQTAVVPSPVPTYSYKTSPYGTSIQSFSPSGAGAIPSGLFSGTTGTDLSSLLMSPIGLIGIGLIAIIALKK